MHERWYSRLFLYKHLIIFRFIRCVSNSANFDITEINNGSKCLGGGFDDLKVRTLRGRGFLENVQKCARREGGV